MPKKISYLISLITLSCVLFAGIFFLFWWNQPLGQALMIPSLTIEPVSSSIQDGMSTAAPTSTQIPDIPTATAVDGRQTGTDTITPKPEDPTATLVPPTPTSTATPDRPKPIYILAAGTDSRYPGYQGGLADVIRIARIDFEIPRVTVLTLPRDLWVELPGIKEEFDTLTHGKLNTAYTHGLPSLGRYEGEGGAPGLLAHTIAHNYGLVVDHYVVIDMDVFVDIINALDGIDIFLHSTWDGRADTENPDHSAWVFEEGQHHMKGEEALRFARIRLNYSEITRTDNQTMVICAVREKIMRPNVFTALPNLVKAFHGRLQTDLSPAQISQLIALLPKLEPENLLFVRFPNHMFVQGRTFDPFIDNTTFIWDIPIEDIRQFMRDFEKDAITVEIGGGGGRICP